jgi:hypothetical protein
MSKHPYWVEFDSRAAVCVEATDPIEATSLAVAETKASVVKVRVLPYPAEPRVGERGDCPSFCYRPRECAGRTACPQAYACSE